MRYAQLVERRNNLRENLFENPSAETNANYYNMGNATGGAATLTRMTDGGYSGTSYIRYTCTTAPSTTGGGIFISHSSPVRLPVTTGISYTASGFVRSSVSRSYQANIDWYDAGGTKLSNASGTAVASIGIAQWVQIFVTATAPANAVSCYVTFYATGAPIFAVNDYYDLDAVVFEATGITGFNVSYFDGSSPNARWEGTAHASASLELADLRSRNQIADSAFAFAYKPTLSTTGVGNVGSYFGCPFRTVVDGTMGNCLEYVTNSAVNPQGTIVFPQKANALGYASRSLSQIGETYTSSTYMLIPAGLTFFLGFRLTNAANVSIDGPTTAIVGTGAWQRYSATATINGGSAGYYMGFQCRANNTIPPIGTIIRVAQIQTERGSSPTTFTATRPDW